ncbi:hypothetical protein Dcar01_00078 [Deinococcus carri]|uniref:Uncharacterized protein n=1 Tax=Deinococcus carri TaxID=1211323 RepID=A0ABP9W2Z3_9DEIO
MGFFRKELAALGKEGGQRLDHLREQGHNIAVRAQAFARNPVKALGNGARGMPAELWKKTVGVGHFAHEKLNQFKKWYATPEGKAKFWKGVVLAGVGVATVASGGALTAPALALAAGVSAVGGIGAQVAENAVYNAAARAKARKDRTYTYKARKTFQNVTARSIAVDAAVGGLGGPFAKFAGKALVGSGVALGKGAVPLVKGLGSLGKGAAGAVGQRLVPAGAKKALQTAGQFGKQKVLDPLAELGKPIARFGKEHLLDPTLKNGRKLLDGARDLAGEAGKKLAPVGRGAEQLLLKQIRAVGRFARNASGKVTAYAREGIKSGRKLDRRALTRLKLAARKNPATKLARQLRDGVDDLGNRVSKRLVAGKVRAADTLDSLKGNIGGKFGQSGIAQYARNLKDTTVKRLDKIVMDNPGGDYAKAITQFRASGTAIRTHLQKVWGEASQDLNKDLSRLLGRHGSVQADFRNLAQKGNRELYDQEVEKARQLATGRLRDKVQQDYETASLARQQRGGRPTTEAEMAVIRADAAKAAEDAVVQSADHLTREAEKFVARHHSTVLEQAALRVQATEGAQKAAEYYFGKNSGQKGLLEKTGMAMTAPFRKVVNERTEKYEKFVKALRSSTPMSSVTLLGTEAVTEQTQKELTKRLGESVEPWADEFKGEPKKPRKATAEDGSVVLGIFDKAFEDVLPPLPQLDDFQNKLEKDLNMKEDE